MQVAVSEGQVLAGKYRVERLLGEGGMGYVVAAVHVHLQQRVAIKFLHGEACHDPTAVARFVREARAAFQIESEHVARVMDVGALETGEPYLVMEFLTGADLSRVLRSEGPLPVGRAVNYVLEAAEALAEAHALGIVHRDLKPANMFLAERRHGAPIIKLLDFGISKMHAPADVAGDVTSTGALLGSPRYMAPEQVRNAKDVDPRADIWALGVVLHELLTTTYPFAGEVVSAVFAAIVADPPVPIRTLRADVPADLEVIILRCLEKEPHRRFPTVKDLVQALQPFAAPGFWNSGPPASGGDRRSASPALTLTAPAPATGKTRHRTTALWLAAALAFVTAAFAVVFLSEKLGPPPAPAAVTGLGTSAALTIAGANSPVPSAPVASASQPSPPLDPASSASEPSAADGGISLGRPSNRRSSAAAITARNPKPKPPAPMASVPPAGVWDEMK